MIGQAHFCAPNWALIKAMCNKGFSFVHQLSTFSRAIFLVTRQAKAFFAFVVHFVFEKFCSHCSPIIYNFGLTV